MPRNIFWCFIFFAVLFLVGCQFSPPTPTLIPVPPTFTPTLTAIPTLVPSPQPTPTPFYSRVENDVTYCTVNGDALKLDLYFPKTLNQTFAPVALNVHGGSWSNGDKKENETSRDFSAFTAHGYIVAAVNYRHAPAHKFPAQIQDVKCAVRFLRANALKYRIDANRIGAFGCSAGGHLVAMLGLTDLTAGFDGGEYADFSSRVQAVIAMSAPTDLTLYNPSRLDMLERVFGATSITDTVLTNFSPVHYISKNAPPFLIIAGDADKVVPPRQSNELFDRLKAEGITTEMLLVKNGDHCLLADDVTMTPSRDQVSQVMVNFFDQMLRK